MLRLFAYQKPKASFLDLKTVLIQIAFSIKRLSVQLVIYENPLEKETPSLTLNK